MIIIVIIIKQPLKNEAHRYQSVQTLSTHESVSNFIKNWTGSESASNTSIKPKRNNFSKKY